MFSKKVLSEFRQLHHARFRNETGLFLAEGEKVVKDLLHSELEVVAIAALPSYLDTMGQLPGEVTVYQISESDLDKVSQFKTPNKVIAMARKPALSNFEIQDTGESLLVLDSIRDPGNLGTLLRTADWFGIRQVICSADTTDCYNAKVVQGAMGSLFRLKVWYGELPGYIHAARNQGLTILGATMEGIPYREVAVDGPFCLIIGSESHGISRQTGELADHKISIPKIEGSEAESLNAAVACGILLAAYKGQ